MNCVKCNTQTNGDILCNSCSDDILKLYLIEKIPADEIEKTFNLLPNTVEYWYNYCKGKNGDDFSYLIVDNITQEKTPEDTTSNINIEENFTQDNIKNDNIKRGVFTVVTFILVNISMFIPYTFAFWFMFAGAMGTVQGEGLLYPTIIMLFSLGIVFSCLKFSHFILKKLKIMENFLIEKLYKGLCNILCGCIVLLVLLVVVTSPR